MNLITGHRGELHVTSSDQGAVNAGLIGTKVYALNVGSKFEAEIVPNGVKINDGILMMNGRAARIDTYETVTIEPGQVGFGRIDVIAAHYVKDSDGIESCELAVLKGASRPGGGGAEPTPIEGDILAGDTDCLFPLYAVKITDTSITSVESRFVIATSIADMTAIGVKVSDLDAYRPYGTKVLNVTIPANGTVGRVVDISSKNFARTPVCVFATNKIGVEVAHGNVEGVETDKDHIAMLVKNNTNAQVTVGIHLIYMAY